MPSGSNPDFIAVEEAAQTLLVAEIERHIAAIGGINVARRLFKQITPIYDQAMGRYHIVPAISMSAGANPRIRRSPSATFSNWLSNILKPTNPRRPIARTGNGLSRWPRPTPRSSTFSPITRRFGARWKRKRC